MDAQQFQVHMHYQQLILTALQSIEQSLGVAPGTPNGQQALTPNGQQFATTGYMAPAGNPNGQHNQAAQQLTSPQSGNVGGVTSDMLLQLVQPLVDNPNARPLLQQAMAQLGIPSLPEAKPEQYNALYAAFKQVEAYVQQASSLQAQQAQQAQAQQFQPQGQQFQPQVQQFQPQGGLPQGQQFQPQQNFNPQAGQMGQQGGGVPAGII